jgi:hypothetical protein
MIKPLQDAGMTYDQIASALEIDSSNFIGMVKNPKNKALFPLDRLPALAKLCNLTNREIIGFAIARIRDAKANNFEMTVDTFKWLLKTFAKVALSRHGLWLVARLA